jgi:hypothetical protein
MLDAASHSGLSKPFRSPNSMLSRVKDTSSKWSSYLQSFTDNPVLLPGLWDVQSRSSRGELMDTDIKLANEWLQGTEVERIVQSRDGESDLTLRVNKSFHSFVYFTGRCTWGLVMACDYGLDQFADTSFFVLCRF